MMNYNVMQSQTNNQGQFKQIGDWKIDMGSYLGSGSFSKVYTGYKVTDESLKVAIKIIDNNFMMDNYVKGLLESEIEAMKNLKHRNIVQLHDVVITKHNIYMVIEFCNGGDLDDYIKKYINPIKDFGQKLRKCLKILGQIQEGYYEVARLGYIHRDLKPANIFINNEIFKIGDFGFAKQIKNLTQQISRKSVIGSPLYMSPQLLNNNSFQYTTKHDIWAIGIIFFEMLFGDTPWSQSQSEKELATNIDRQNPQQIVRQQFVKLQQMMQKHTLDRETQLLLQQSVDFLDKSLQTTELKRMSWMEMGSHKLFKQLKALDQQQQVQPTKQPQKQIAQQQKVVQPQQQMVQQQQVVQQQQQVVATPIQIQQQSESSKKKDKLEQRINELFSDESMHSFESDESHLDLQQHTDENIFNKSKEESECGVFYENVSLCIKDIWDRVEQLSLISRQSLETQNLQFFVNLKFIINQFLGLISKEISNQLRESKNSYNLKNWENFKKSDIRKYRNVFGQLFNQTSLYKNQMKKKVVFDFRMQAHLQNSNTKSCLQQNLDLARQFVSILVRNLNHELMVQYSKLKSQNEGRLRFIDIFNLLKGLVNIHEKIESLFEDKKTQELSYFVNRMNREIDEMVKLEQDYEEDELNEQIMDLRKKIFELEI